MRFIENGPPIPDELLLARDQGRVVFFCGAGVSREKAKLPDFFGLAEDAIDKLGAPSGSSARRILDEAREIEARTGIAGLISADRIFGLLERDFLVSDIEAAVASSLKPSETTDLAAHQTLLDLATTPEGAVRLVTTNFDRLFDACGRDLQSWKPPCLPDPSRSMEMNGVIYLHGKATADYRGAEGDGFVLSSSQFGRAYLSDGWATSFFREILDKYVVAFVGYTADDPPVHYLLEALSKKTGSLEGVYAFQSGEAADATSKWIHKGVDAIPYDAGQNHSALWRTLEAWADRARDSDHWYSEVIDRSQHGPERLLPHERGQLAHIVSTTEGLRRFAERDEPPPAEWLCVFDPHRRYATPCPSDSENSGPDLDPFDSYCIDSDIPPTRADPDNDYAERVVPPGAWDAFAANRLDRINLNDTNLSSPRRPWSTTTSILPSRLSRMGLWISKIAHQPPAVWWAVLQGSLHPEIRERIRWELERSQPSWTSEVRKAWLYLLEHWEHNGSRPRDWSELEAEIEKDGWDLGTIRRFAANSRPCLKVEPSFWRGRKPPNHTQMLALSELMSLHVAYPEAAQIDIPDEWVASVTKELRKNLEVALELESEIGGYGLYGICPIRADDDPNRDPDGRTRGLSGAVVLFSKLFGRLVRINLETARREFSTWSTDDSSIFARLRIWAASEPQLVPESRFGIVLAEVSKEAFWDGDHARDLLLTLSSRWNALSDETRVEIEHRLLDGPSRSEGETDADFAERRAWSILSRISWLSQNQCELHLDFEAEVERLRPSAPGWRPEYADRAAESLEGRGGLVRTETEYSALLSEPLASTLSKARELGGRQDDFLLERAPYAGLAAERPVRAFSALRLAAERQDFPEWAWRTFLNSEARKGDKPKLVALIAERMARYSVHALAEILRPAAGWLASVSAVLAQHFPASFDRIVIALIRTLETNPRNSESAMVSGNRHEWTMEAINAPTGKVAQALFGDPRKDGLITDGGFPPDWLEHVRALIALPGDLRRHSLVVFAHNLQWFYEIDSEWSKENLLSVLDSNDLDDKGAFWEGFLWAGKVPNQELYAHIKPHLLQLAKRGDPMGRGHGEVLLGVILAGWGSVFEGQRCVSNDELRDILTHVDDPMRSHVLFKMDRWASISATEDGTENSWVSLLPELLSDVWPRLRSVKSPAISARLFDLAFSNEERFSELAEVILPLLTRIELDHLMPSNLRRPNANIVERYPRMTLALLHAVLPDRVSAWPYGIEETLIGIGEADSTLRTDERLLELNRKWNAR